MINQEDYGYVLPENNLALSPAVPRDSSKLFIYNTLTDQISFDHFYNIDKYLPKNSFIILNNTKVIPARVSMKKASGGKIVVLFLVNELKGMSYGLLGSLVRVMTDRKINVGEKLYFESGDSADVISQKEHFFELRYLFSREKLFELLQIYGSMPIPPYLKKSPLKRDELLEKYQTIFARAPKSTLQECTLASVAAPTASLHFTRRVMDKLDKIGIEKFFITLHVGLGTFAPITEANIKSKKLHEEYYEIDDSAFQLINRLKKDGRKLIAVGTTVVRTLESIARQRVFSSTSPQWGPKSLTQKQLPSLGKTDLFIFPPHDFNMVDIMVTNFHLPKSSLMMLVEAFLQFKGATQPSPRLRRAKKRSLVELYNVAIKNNFRFYSFGDVMLIL
ncbi:MAG: S-adenosylmethionine:tRNA ribosyltransferase-isomerase [Candidatus Roizmanbacteria bacterium GW2011_GWA2_35_8]|uniref:S-adenosylmethionine:tRNA ribosyltransferase-isomerase n=1 Tax=Candidatus Roizmanbacteria bacterium GW2011_GWA2_35_8 TaxID=1618479 RepID=A0A0G0CZ49_9BACT|nr:MAG: S-adenosylmethionine:tRNA ribosyltransferase-isomerase [Candidatus Roizmanbacteria bacterium GW2011_GWA2_35_8]